MRDEKSSRHRCQTSAASLKIGGGGTTLNGLVAASGERSFDWLLRKSGVAPACTIATVTPLSEGLGGEGRSGAQHAGSAAFEARPASGTPDRRPRGRAIAVGPRRPLAPSAGLRTGLSLSRGARGRARSLCRNLGSTSDTARFTCPRGEARRLIPAPPKQRRSTVLYVRHSHPSPLVGEGRPGAQHAGSAAFEARPASGTPDRRPRGRAIAVGPRRPLAPSAGLRTGLSLSRGARGRARSLCRNLETATETARLTRPG